jgi:hypothetical protein
MGEMGRDGAFDPFTSALEQRGSARFRQVGAITVAFDTVAGAGMGCTEAPLTGLIWEAVGDNVGPVSLQGPPAGA